MQREPATNRQSGFTLIELIVAVILIGILGLIGSELLLSGFVTTARVNANNESSAVARYAVERINREIRETAGGSSIYEIIAADSKSMVFSSTLERASLAPLSSDDLTKSLKVVGFDLDSKIVSLRVDTLEVATGAITRGEASTLITNVEEFTLVYYNSSGQVASALSSIRSVGVDMVLRAENSPAIRVGTLISLRN